MNPATASAKSASLLPAQRADALPAIDFPEVFSHAMDHAIGMHKASFEVALRLQSQALDAYKDRYQEGYWFTPGLTLTNWMEIPAMALACFMDWQLMLASLFIPAVPAPAVDVSPAQLPAERLENAIGAGSRPREESASRNKAMPNH